MADEPLRIKVDKNVYQQTLDSLETQLEALQSHKENLQRQLDRLNSGNTFAGSDVRSAIEKTEEVLKTVGDSISRVMGYKMTIQQLDGIQSAGTQLSGKMASIDIPNMFN